MNLHKWGSHPRHNEIIEVMSDHRNLDDEILVYAGIDWWGHSLCQPTIPFYNTWGGTWGMEEEDVPAITDPYDSFDVAWAAGASPAGTKRGADASPTD